MKPASVLFVAWAPFFSGAERALLLTLRSLDADRYRPVVLAGTDGDFVAQVRSLGIACEVAELNRLELRRPVAGLSSVLAVLKIARKHRVSLVHTNELPVFQPAGYAARLLRLPSVTHVRFPNGGDGFRYFARPGFSLALFVSQDLLETGMQEAPDVFTGRCTALHDGVEIQPEWSDDERRQRRRQLGLPEQSTLVAMAGQVAEVKGIWDFVEAAKILAARGAEPSFVVLGDDLKTGGETRRAMEARVAALGLAGRFTFLGFRRDAPEVVQAFDVIAVPSHVEPLGNATLEAMAAGIPVVGSRVGGIPEMVVDHVTGLLVTPRTPSELADAIARLTASPSLRADMAVAARRRARDTFGIPAHGQKLQAHYDRLRGI